MPAAGDLGKASRWMRGMRLFLLRVGFFLSVPWWTRLSSYDLVLPIRGAIRHTF